ncbi:caspase domain-containing protein [Mycena latifolia]|nr:caspase domain-containing protein [Mycena latifolia]
MNDADFSARAKSIFALVVGIDKYQANDEFNTLTGAVNDAKSFAKYLTDSHETGGLQVPSSHIELLENEKATRFAILSAFDSHLLNNPAIPDDGQAAMVFFFAGHGSRVESPGNLLATDGKVEVICPVDERTVDLDRNRVHAIPDYLLAQKLYHLAMRKGNNITVILDSCHSGGMGRDGAQSKVRSPPRSSQALPEPGDDHSDPTRSYRLWSPSSATYVLLAACCQRGRAYESASRPFQGHFTEKLIAALRKNTDKTTTYADLIENLPALPVKTQIPHCGGAHRDRLVFTTDYPARGMRTVPLRETHVFCVETKGTAGVREGAECCVYDASDAIVCTLVARMVTEDLVVLASLDGPVDAPKGSHVVVDERRNISVPLGEHSSFPAFLIRTGSFEGVREGMIFPIRAPDTNIIGTLVAKIVNINQALLVPLDGKTTDLPKGSRAVVKDWKDKVRVFVPSDFTPKLFPLSPEDAQRYEEAESYRVADIALRKEEGDVVIQRLTGTTIGYHHETHFQLKDPQQLPNAIGGIAHFHYFLERHNESTLLSGFELKMNRLEGVFPHRRPIPSENDGGNLIKAIGENLYKAEINSDRDATYGFTICNKGNQDLFSYLFYFDPVEYTIQASAIFRPA